MFKSNILNLLFEAVGKEVNLKKKHFFWMVGEQTPIQGG